MGSLTETELRIIQKCMAGEENAFETIFQMYHGRLLYYVRRLVPDQDSADDVMQEVWLAVYRRITSLREPQAFKIWLYRIARNQAAQIFRTREFDQISPEELEAIPEPRAAAELPNEDVELIHHSLQRLKPKHREVITLKYLEELSYEQMAAIIGIDVGTVRSRLFYAKSALRTIVEEGKHGQTQ